MRNPFELPEDVALVDVWREVVVDAEKSIELLQQGYNLGGVSADKQIDKYRAMVLEALQEIEKSMKTEMKASLESDAMKKAEMDGKVSFCKNEIYILPTNIETMFHQNVWFT